MIHSPLYPLMLWCSGCCCLSLPSPWQFSARSVRREQVEYKVKLFFSSNFRFKLHNDLRWSLCQTCDYRVQSLWKCFYYHIFNIIDCIVFTSSLLMFFSFFFVVFIVAEHFVVTQWVLRLHWCMKRCVWHWLSCVQKSLKNK